MNDHAKAKIIAYTILWVLFWTIVFGILCVINSLYHITQLIV